MKSLFVPVAIVLALGASACKTTKPEPAAKATDAPVPQPPTTGSRPQLASPVAVPGATVATLPNMPIPERFVAERRGRPSGVTPSVEDVYAALEKSGIRVVDRKQHLGAPFGARYCVGARAVGPGDASMMHISVCEFVNADAARIGRDYSAEGMKSIPFRTVYANKATTLTLREERHEPNVDALVDTAAATYATL
jgi:hypothetical protein